LTPAQFAQQFSVSIINTILVQEYLNKLGIYVSGQSSNGAVLNVTGSIAAFVKAFGLHINYYQKNDGTLFFAPDAEPTIPATLAGMILAVGGLDNLHKYLAHRQQYPMRALPKATGSGPGGFLAPGDVKTAYNLNAVAANGSGQNVALFELDGYSSKDIQAYESKFGVPSVPLQNVLIDGFSGLPNYGSNGGADEVTLDIELLAAFAPGTSDILVYEAPNTTQAWIDEWTRIATDNKAKVISCSWGEPEMDSPTINFDNMIFAQMAAQGQAVFVAAGDNGAFDAGGSSLAVDEPASQPYATAVA
jgi:kumamolisin